MKRLLLALMVLASAHALIAQTTKVKVSSTFHPPEALSVTDITIPTGSLATGTVVLDALLTEAGKVQKVEVRRNIPGLTELATQAVKGWKFSPATLGGKPIASRMPVAVNFRPLFLHVAPVQLPPLIRQNEAAIQAEFQPAEVLRAAYPDYPLTTTAIGTAVLEVTVSETGKAGEVKVLCDLPPLTDEAKAAVGDWRFTPATFNGNPVRSKLVLAFVFQTALNVAP